MVVDALNVSTSILLSYVSTLPLLDHLHQLSFLFYSLFPYIYPIVDCWDGKDGEPEIYHGNYT